MQPDLIITQKIIQNKQQPITFLTPNKPKFQSTKNHRFQRLTQRRYHEDIKKNDLRQEIKYISYPNSSREGSINENIKKLQDHNQPLNIGESENSINLKNINQNIFRLVTLFEAHIKRQTTQSKQKIQALQPKIKSNRQSIIPKQKINHYFDKFQPRFTYIDLQIPQQNTLQKILIWVGELCKRVFSAGFSLLKEGQLNQKKVKAYCSQNILRNLIKLGKNKDLQASVFQAINKCLKNELLPYFCLKYPQTQEKNQFTKFQNLLNLKDTLGENENDLCQKSQVYFSLQEDSNYNPQIMKFLNFIISLPGRLPGLASNEENHSESLGQLFKKDMSEIFESIFEEKTLLKMHSYNSKNLNLLNINVESLPIIQKLNNKKKQSDEQVFQKSIRLNQRKNPMNNSKTNKNQQQIKYQEMVRQYTTYQIDEKLKNISLFKQYEIKTGNLNLSNTTLMRVVTKWCQQLQKYFDPDFILNRQNSWRMKDGSQKYMKKVQMIALNTLLQIEKEKIDQRLQQIRQNNHQNQVYFCQKQVSSQLDIYSQEEASVGQFCSSIFKINQNYLVNYLNMLIHGINKALTNFQKLQRIKCLKVAQVNIYQNIFEGLVSQKNQKNECSSLSHKQNKELIKKKLQFAEQQIQKFVNIHKKYDQTPQLITFKIGDLLRCKCTSKQSEIIALYKLIEYISHHYPHFMKILRVKNKLSSGNKDILMNIMYRQSVIIEMQLAIKSQKTKFIQCSNKFNHFFYEMKRAQFGPIMQMCSIWVSHDQRSQFYLDRLNKKNTRKQEKSLLSCCQKSRQQIINVPFKCVSCDYFYFKCNFYQKHSRCQNCGIICFRCRIQSLKKNKKQLSHLFSEFLNFGKKQMRICNEFPMNGGYLINVSSKKKNIKVFKPILYQNYYYLFHYVNKRTQKQYLEVIYKFRADLKKQSFEYFSESNIIFLISQRELPENIIKLTPEEAQKAYFIPKYFEKLEKQERKSIALIKNYIDEQLFHERSQFPFSSVQKINLSQNSITSVENLNKKFPNAQLAVINNNKIKKIQQQQVSNWKQTMVRIYLKSNSIFELNGIGCLKKLIELDLEDNSILHFPNIILEDLKTVNLQGNQLVDLPQNFGKMERITVLNLSKNGLTSFPEAIGKLKNLFTLLMRLNKICEIKQEYLLDLKNLKQFDISMNELCCLPKSIENLEKVQKLMISRNLSTFRPYFLPKSFQKLISLSQLYIFQNCLQKLPQQICSLKNLSQLYIGSNKIGQIPEQFAQLQSLTQLWIHQNQIQILPQHFGRLKNLVKLSICKNRVKKLPESFGQLMKLEKLWIYENQIQRLPESFSCLQNLKQLHINNNKLARLPQFFGKLKKLQKLQIYQNNVKSLPESFGGLINLLQFSINNNQLSKLPKQFGNLTKLRKLQIDNNKIDKLPDQFCNLESLNELYINNNNIKVLPSQFGNLNKLQKLYIYENELERLPESFGNLSRLSKLIINNNRLQNLPNSFPNLTNLKILEINDNQLNQLPRQFHRLSNLQKLFLHQNQILHLPQQFGNFKNLIAFTIFSPSKNNVEEKQIIQKIPLQLQKLGIFLKDATSFIPKLKQLSKLKFFKLFSPIKRNQIKTFTKVCSEQGIQFEYDKIEGRLTKKSTFRESNCQEQAVQLESQLTGMQLRRVSQQRQNQENLF